MNSLLHTVMGLPLLWLATVLAASLVAALFYPLLRSITRRYIAETRAFILLVYAVTAPVTATVMVILALQPQLGAALIQEHCHEGVCLPHAPLISAATLSGMVLIISSAIVVLGFIGLVQLGVMRSQQRLHTLQMLSSATGPDQYRVVDSPGLLAWCGGLLRPQIYVSSGLLAILAPEQLRAVIAHEYAHVCRRDNLRTLILRIATAVWLPPVKKQLWNDFSASTEEACDRAAAARQHPQAVITALSILAEKRGQQPPGLSPAFQALDPLRRVAALQWPQGKQGFALLGWLMVVLPAVVSILLFTGIAHLAVEWLTVPGSFY